MADTYDQVASHRQSLLGAAASFYLEMVLRSGRPRITPTCPGRGRKWVKRINRVFERGEDRSASRYRLIP
jgi:hypothetical protein